MEEDFDFYLTGEKVTRSAPCASSFVTLFVCVAVVMIVWLISSVVIKKIKERGLEQIIKDKTLENLELTQVLEEEREDFMKLEKNLKNYIKNSKEYNTKIKFKLEEKIFDLEEEMYALSNDLKIEKQLNSILYEKQKMSTDDQFEKVILEITKKSQPGFGYNINEEII